jgi:hypothetical protein
LKRAHGPAIAEMRRNAARIMGGFAGYPHVAGKLGG